MVVNLLLYNYYQSPLKLQPMAV